EARQSVVQLFRDRRSNNRLADRLVLDGLHLLAAANFTPFDNREFGTLLGPEFCLHRTAFELDDREGIAAAQPLHVRDTVGKTFDGNLCPKRAVEKRVRLRRKRVEEVGNVLANPRSTGFAIQADFPLFLRDLRVEFINIRQWLAGACHHRVGRLAAAPALKCLSSAQSNKPLGWGDAKGIGPFAIHTPQDRAADKTFPSLNIKHDFEPLRFDLPTNARRLAFPSWEVRQCSVRVARTSAEGILGGGAERESGC